MSRAHLAKYFHVLEIPTEATLRDVQNAYLRLKRLYSDHSIVLAPLEEEFTDKKRLKVLEEIEEAYHKLLAGIHAEPPKAAALFPEESPGVPVEKNLENMAYSGVALRKVRERLGIDLNEIAKELKLRLDLLRAVEDERFEALPEEAYLKGHLKNYARYLGLNVDRVLEDYLGRYVAWKAKKPGLKR